MSKTKKIKKLLLPVLPVAAKKIAAKLDGKKTITGLILTGAGVGCLFVPALQSIGVDLLVTGVPLTITGIIHKIHKIFKRKKEVNN